MSGPNPIDMENARDATIDAGEVEHELHAVRTVLDQLRPFTDEARARILASVAGRLGHYAIAIELLKYARETG